MEQDECKKRCSGFFRFWNALFEGSDGVKTGSEELNHQFASSKSQMWSVKWSSWIARESSFKVG